MKKIYKILFLLLAVSCPYLFGQSSGNNVTTILNPAPFISPRASSMAGAISTISQGIDTAYYNPSMIGGQLQFMQNKIPTTVHFPFLGISTNANTKELRNEFAKEGGSNDANVGQAIIDANAGKKQYARSTQSLGLSMGRSIALAISDVQLAAVKTTGENSEEGDIELAFKSTSNLGAGFSFLDPKGKFSLGFFTSSLNISDLHASNVLYNDIISAEERKTLQNENTYKWSGLSTHVGMSWIIEKKINTVISLVSRDVGDTKLELNSHPDNVELSPDQKIKFIKQDLTLGASISPKFGNNYYLNFIIEAYDLVKNKTEFHEIFRTGLEFSFMDFGPLGIASVRTGANHAGVAFGGSINLGLIEFSYASEPVDIGTNGERLIERREQMALYIKITE